MISESDSRGSHIIRVIALCVITLLTDSGERKGKRPRCSFNSFASSLDGPNISKSITLTLYSKNRKNLHCDKTDPLSNPLLSGKLLVRQNSLIVVFSSKEVSMFVVVYKRDALLLTQIEIVDVHLLTRLNDRGTNNSLFLTREQCS